MKTKKDSKDNQEIKNILHDIEILKEIKKLNIEQQQIETKLEQWYKEAYTQHEIIAEIYRKNIIFLDDIWITRFSRDKLDILFKNCSNPIIKNINFDDIYFWLWNKADEFENKRFFIKLTNFLLSWNKSVPIHNPELVFNKRAYFKNEIDKLIKKLKWWNQEIDYNIIKQRLEDFWNQD